MIGLTKERLLIKYPNEKRILIFNKTKKKKMIIGVVGNGNKGKSFILRKLSNYNIPQGFTITTERSSIRYNKRENHCIAILDSIGQEIPLSNSETMENIKKREIKDLNSDKEENKKIFFFGGCLRDKLITKILYAKLSK